MNGFRLTLTLGLALLALASRAVCADGDQSDVISAHGDALARSTSAEALVEPKPSVPPNSAPPVVPSATAAVAAPAVARPAVVVPAAPVTPGVAPQTPPPPVADVSASSAPSPLPPPAAPRERKRGALIFIGALIALAMFLWERRRKD